jgi:phosphatidylglycerophosphate synthase
LSDNLTELRPGSIAATGPASFRIADLLDRKAKSLIDPLLNRIARRLAVAGISANAVTLAGFVLGIASAAAAAGRYFHLALLLLLLSRLCDGLDGAVARQGRSTDFGGFLDIVLDFAFYGAVPVGFAVADPRANALAAAVLVLSFYVNGATFLAYAIIAEKRGIPLDQRGGKSFLFTVGLAEATETIVVFAAMCLFPAAFAPLALLFAAVCFYTAAMRIMLARKAFAEIS